MLPQLDGGRLFDEETSDCGEKRKLDATDSVGYEGPDGTMSLCLESEEELEHALRLGFV